MFRCRISCKSATRTAQVPQVHEPAPVAHRCCVVQAALIWQPVLSHVLEHLEQSSRKSGDGGIVKADTCMIMIARPLSCRAVAVLQDEYN
jgi:hypothetical protein